MSMTEFEILLSTMYYKIFFFFGTTYTPPVLPVISKPIAFYQQKLYSFFPSSQLFHIVMQLPGKGLPIIVLIA